MQAEIPRQVAHIRAALDVYMDQLKEAAKRSLSHLDDPEYTEFK